MRSPTVKLLISCPDTRGIIAAVTSFIARHQGNIVELDQHTEDSSGQFYMRIELERAGFALSDQSFSGEFSPLARTFAMQWRATWDIADGGGKRIVICVSKEGHCLSDLLYRWQSGELEASIVAVIGNHADLAPLALAAGVPFIHLPIIEGDRQRQEAAMLAKLDELSPDLVVLARYMQVLSPVAVKAYHHRLINIHHSFLPAFVGPKPYHQAFARGVKIIGATSHYVTDALDAGPIIAQSVAHVGHRDGVADMIRIGRDLERVVLAKAVRLHTCDKILVGGNKTVVFD